MTTVDFKGKQLSLLGFGAMRLPQLENGSIDEAQLAGMVEYAISNGVNYFDTAYPYHGGESERVLGRVLGKYPRDSFYLATKFPGHQVSSGYRPEEVFEEQLQKCGVDYFDFYLLHNVYEKSIENYKDPQLGIIDYFVEQKRLGRIRHLGFSSHGGTKLLRDFLDEYGDIMEFCQLQLNYLDWSLQSADERYQLLTDRGIPVWVMEPVRGGRLASLAEGDEQRLKALRPGESVASWGFRWLMTLPNVRMILSGMSNGDQLADNVKTFSSGAPLSAEEIELLYGIAEGMKSSLPCTACRYCCDDCPAGLDIPELIDIYNQLRFMPSVNISMRAEALPEDKQPSACLACGACAAVCPQNIDIPTAMQEFSETLSRLPTWEEICRERDEEILKNRII